MSDILFNLRSNYIADVKIELQVNGIVYPIAKTGPGYFVLSCEAEPLSADALLRMSVDGRIHTWNIHLLNGAVPFDSRVEFKYLDTTL